MFEIVDPYLDGDGWSVVWVPSTPHYCLDHLQCLVEDTVEHNGGTASLLISNVSGEIFHRSLGPWGLRAITRR